MRRVVETLGLWSCGGGERSRGETGQRGLSRGYDCSVMIDVFCGPADLAVRSDDTGNRVGVVAAEIVLEPGGRMDLTDRGVRAGLVSCWLFLLDLDTAVAEAERAADVDALMRERVGETSREATGDWLKEVLAEDCFDGWLSSPPAAEEKDSWEVSGSILRGGPAVKLPVDELADLSMEGRLDADERDNAGSDP